MLENASLAKCVLGEVFMKRSSSRPPTKVDWIWGGQCQPPWFNGLAS